MTGAVGLSENIKSEVATKIIPISPFVFPKKLSMHEFYKLFPDNDSCKKYLEEVRWNNSPFCSHCGSSNVTFLKRKRFQCNDKNCRQQFTVTVGTLFQNNSGILSQWFQLIYSFAINKKNISSVQHGKNLGVTMATSWNMGHKLRQLLNERESFKLSGVVEIDECFVSKNTGRYRSSFGGFSTRKAPILGMIERGGRVKIIPIDNRFQTNLTAIISNHVEAGSTIYTDGWRGYNLLSQEYDHHFITHHTGEYVRGEIHTNTIENLWMQLKKSIRGAHHSVSDKYIEFYCNEFAYRYNRRHCAPMDIFRDIIHRAVNKEPFISIAN